MLSVVIPSYKDPHLEPTIQSLLDNARGDIEVIPVLDGYEPEKRIDDPRVRYIYQENQGMREAINTGVDNARGEYLMRTDAHAIFGPSYDIFLTAGMHPNWIVKPRRFKLNPETWTIIDEPAIDYEKLLIEKTHHKFHGVEWTAKTNANKDILIDEDMAMQGSCWAMPHDWWDKTIGRLDSNGYGTHYQDSIEMIFKTWQAGGKLMVNKKTWHAHKHRDFNRTHNYPNSLSRASWDYALEVWGDYYKDVVYPKWFK